MRPLGATPSRAPPGAVPGRLRAAPAIEAFEKPVTLPWGTDDDLFPLAHAARLRDAFPNATLIEIPDCSAFVMLDAPGVLADAIRTNSTGSP